ncbi:hypothetical protein DFH27DRAFT_535895 [Peziza echinospora]|nr:hypothetical protein DFH27DRAFT_535895 [Peziza echinospora]
MCQRRRIRPWSWPCLPQLPVCLSICLLQDFFFPSLPCQPYVTLGGSFPSVVFKRLLGRVQTNIILDILPNGPIRYGSALPLHLPSMPIATHHHHSRAFSLSRDCLCAGFPSIAWPFDANWAQAHLMSRTEFASLVSSPAGIEGQSVLLFCLRGRVSPCFGVRPDTEAIASGQASQGNGANFKG